MENLDQVTQDADEVVAPSTGEETPNESVEEKELSEEELALEVERLKEEAKKQKDPKEKRHLEQQAGWTQKIIKEREKAKSLEEANKQKEESISRVESLLIEEVYEKAMDAQKGGVPYFEKIMESDPELANKVAQVKFGKTAKQLISDSYKSNANEGNEDAKHKVTMEEMEAKAEHKLAIREANKVFNDLDGEERETAKRYFDKISGKGYLELDEALEYADMAKHYATRNRKIDNKDKEKILANNANTSIGTSRNTNTPVSKTSDLERQYIELGIDPITAKQLANVQL